MKKFLAPLFLLACGLVFLTGCSNSSKIIAVGLRPEITAIEVNASGTASANWQIVNTNVVSYLLSRVEHRLYLDGKLVGKIRSTSPIAVPKQTSAGATDSLEFETGGAALVSAAVGRDVNYRVETHITIQIYGETTEKSVITNIGSVSVVQK
jgi:hypothetical protein